MSSTDPLDRIAALVEEAREERNRISGRGTSAHMENHQLRRRLARLENDYRELDSLNQQLKAELADAEERAEQSRRAMLDHAART